MQKLFVTEEDNVHDGDEYPSYDCKNIQTTITPSYSVAVATESLFTREQATQQTPSKENMNFNLDFQFDSDSTLVSVMMTNWKSPCSHL